MKKLIRSTCTKKLLLPLTIITALSSCGGSGGDKRSDNNLSSSQSVSSATTTLSSAANSVSSTANSTSSSTNSSVVSSQSKSSSSFTSSSVSSVSFEPGAKPNAFSFMAVTDAKANTTVISNIITVTGITKTISISITGGEYSIDSGAYTSTAGTVSNNQTVTTRLKSASASKTLSSATLNLGGLTGSFDVTTLEDTVAPTAQIMFPTPVSLTETNSILVRGIASDSANEIESLTVNGVQATTTDGYANWQAEVPLSTGANNLIVSTKDAANNVASSAATANIKSGPLAENRTSESEYVLEDPVGVVIDTDRNRAIVMDREDHFSFNAVAIDLTTSSLTYLSGIGYFANLYGGLVLDKSHNRILSQNVKTTWATDLASSEVTRFFAHARSSDSYGLRAIALDADSDRLLLVDADSNEIKAIDLTSATETILSSNTIPNSINNFADPRGIVIDTENRRALVTDYGQNAFSILAVDLTTGARKVLSSNSVPNTDTLLLNPTYITLDKDRNRALIADGEAIFALDLTTGARSVLSSTVIPDTANKFSTVNGIAVDDARKIALVAPYQSGAIYALDLITGKRVVFSK